MTADRAAAVSPSPFKLIPFRRPGTTCSSCVHYIAHDFDSGLISFLPWGPWPRPPPEPDAQDSDGECFCVVDDPKDEPAAPWPYVKADFSCRFFEPLEP